MATRSDMAAVALAGATGIDTPEVPTSPRRRLIRRLASLSSRAAGVVTLVPFVPVRARMWAGAVTGVATAIDVALRPRKERPSAMTYVIPDERQVTSDPVLFATDAASVLASTAIAATRNMASGTRRVATRRTATVIAVTGIAVAGVVVTYRFVLRPVMRRRALREWAESDGAWAGAGAQTAALPGAEIEWAGPDRADVPPESTTTAGPEATPEGGEAPEPPADGVTEMLVVADPAADGAGMLVVAADGAAAEPVADATAESLAADAPAPAKKRRLRRG